jgi:hypothetical protein
MTSEGRRYALIVASSQFSDSTLSRLMTPSRDAAGLARVLGDTEIGNFETIVFDNRPSHEVRQMIETFFSKSKRNDLMLLYFSGHGVKDDSGRLYLATTDTQRGLYRSTAVPATFVHDTMNASSSRWQVLILDCCHSGAFARGMVAKGGESVDLGNRFEAKGRGRVVLTASNATQYAFQGDEIIGEDEGVKSVFTRHLVRGLETGKADLDGDGWVNLDELFDYVHDKVIEETPQQTPVKWAFVEGRINIARSPLGKRVPEPQEARYSRLYAEGNDALTKAEWTQALQCFKELESIFPGYRDTQKQIALLEQAIGPKKDERPPDQGGDNSADISGAEDRSRRRLRSIALPLLVLNLLLATGWGVSVLACNALHSAGMSYPWAAAGGLVCWGVIGLAGLLLARLLRNRLGSPGAAY